MSDNIKKLIDAPVSFWKKQSKKGKIVLSSVLGGLILVSIITSILLNMPKYSVLYPGMDREEALEVMSELDKRGVNYIEDNGTIKVPQEKEDSLRMDLSNEGHPRTAPNYDFFLNNIDMMTTDMEKKIINNYQLNQRLEAVIKNIDIIKDANVTINIPEEKGYVLTEQKSEVTAGVAITIQKGNELTKQQVAGIKRLVSKSVPNLKEENVVVIDTATGEELDASDNTQVDLAKLKMDIANQIEKDISGKVFNILAPIYGGDNVKLAVTSIVDIDKSIQEVITYKPSENNKGVISEETKTAQGNKSGNNAGGIPGMDTNAEIPTYPGITVDQNTIYIKNDQSYKYLVSQMKEQIQRDSGQVKDTTISVVLNQPAIDETQKGELMRLVANTAAISPQKVVIYTSRFEGQPNQETKNNSEQAPEKPMNKNVMIMLTIAAAILLLIIITLFIIIKRKKRALEELQDQLDEAQMIHAEGEEDPDQGFLQLDKIPEIKETKEQVYKKQIQEFTNQNPEIAAQLIRTWLRGEDDE